MNENKDEINNNAYKIELTESKLDSAKENNDEIRKIKTIEVNKIQR